MDEKEKDEKENKDMVVNIVCWIGLIVLLLTVPLSIMPEKYLTNLFTREGLRAYIIAFGILPLPALLLSLIIIVPLLFDSY